MFPTQTAPSAIVFRILIGRPESRGESVKKKRVRSKETRRKQKETGTLGIANPARLCSSFVYGGGASWSGSGAAWHIYYHRSRPNPRHSASPPNDVQKRRKTKELRARREITSSARLVRTRGCTLRAAGTPVRAAESPSAAGRTCARWHTDRGEAPGSHGDTGRRSAHAVAAAGSPPSGAEAESDNGRGRRNTHAGGCGRGSRTDLHPDVGCTRREPHLHRRRLGEARDGRTHRKVACTVAVRESASGLGLGGACLAGSGGHRVNI